MPTEALRAACERHGGRVALAVGDQTSTYSDLLARVRGLAGALRRRGLARERAAVLTRRPDDAAVALFAILEVGGTAVLLSPEMTDREIARGLALSRARAAVSDGDARAGGIPVVPPSAVERDPEPAERTRGAIVFFTSGSTGEPKGALMPAERFVHGITVREDRAALTCLLGFQLDHSAGVGFLFHFLFNGNTVVLPETFTSASCARDMVARRPTAVATTPTLLRNLLVLAPAPPGGFAAVRHLFLTSERVTPDLVEKARRAFPNARIRQNYASTEAGIISTLTDEEQAAHPGAVGRVGSGETDVRIVDGEIWVRSPHQMLGYLEERDPRVDGWFPTGDLGRIEDGYLYVLGRMHGVINVGGQKVDPREVEEVLLGVDGVRAARVYALPNPLTGSIVAADVETSLPDTDENQRLLRSACNRSLQKYKRPRVIRFLHDLPRTRTGKCAGSRGMPT